MLQKPQICFGRKGFQSEAMTLVNVLVHNTGNPGGFLIFANEKKMKRIFFFFSKSFQCHMFDVSKIPAQCDELQMVRGKTHILDGIYCGQASFLDTIHEDRKFLTLKDNLQITKQSPCLFTLGLNCKVHRWMVHCK